MRGTEKFVDIALAITDVNAMLGIIQKPGGLPHVLQPADALLLFDGHSGWVHFLLQSTASMKLVSGPELDGR